MDALEIPYYGLLGFIEGAFANRFEKEYITNSTFAQTADDSYDDSDDDEGVVIVTRNVTSCRLNSIRFINNMTYLVWYSELDYGVDRIMLYAT